MTPSSLSSHRVACVVAAALVLCAASVSAQVGPLPANRFIRSFTANVPAAPGTVAVADFNGDGHADVAVASAETAFAGFITVFLGDGAGGLQQFWQEAAPGLAIGAADFNGDGRIDLATVWHLGYLDIRLGNGDGSFGATTTFAMDLGNAPNSLAIADFDADGDADVAVASTGSVSVMLGNGNGTFTGPTVPLASNSFPLNFTSIVAGDFDHDGDTDLAVGSEFGSVYRLFGNGDGTFFRSPLTIGFGAPISDLAAGDFNGDGHLDLAAALPSGSVGVRSGNGTFAFFGVVHYSAPAFSVVAADVNADGIADVIAGTPASPGDLSVLLGTFAGGLQPAASFAAGDGNDLATGDFNHDGRIDVAIAGAFRQSGSQLILMRGHYLAPQTITFTPPLGNRLFGDPPFQVQATASSGLFVEIRVVAGPATYDGEFLTVTDVGTVHVRGTQSGNDDYENTEGSESFLVLPRPATLTWAPPADITYRTLLDATQLNAEAGIDGTWTYDPPAGTRLGPGTHLLHAHFEPADAIHYLGASAAVTITVNRATPVVTWGEIADIVFGTPISSQQLNAEADVPGAFVYNVALGTVLPAFRVPIRLTFTPDDPGYHVVILDRFLNVLRATPDVTWPPLADIVYGTQLGADQRNATASVAGSFQYTPAAGTVLDGGPQTLSVTFYPFSSDYEQVTTTNTILVRAARPVITWNPVSPMANRTALGPQQVTALANTPGTFTFDPPAGTTMEGGTRQLSLTFTPANLNNFEIAHEIRFITVNTLVPNVSWSPPAVVVGEALGAPHFSATANVPGHFEYVQSPGLSFATAGAYPLNSTFIPDDQVNYQQVQLQRFITVNLATPVITWNPAPMIYGAPLTAEQLNATSNAPGTFTYNPPLGAQPLAIVSTDPLQFQLAVAFVPSDAGTYRSLPDIRATVSASRAPVQITWTTPAPITYGTLLGADQLNAVRSVQQGIVPAPALIYTPLVGTRLDAGTHTLTVRSPQTAFYAEATQTVQIEVRPRPVTINWSTPAPIEYGSPLGGGQLNATVIGGIVGVPASIRYQPAPGTRLAAGTHTLTATIDSPNYEATPVTVNLTVNRVPLFVMAAYTSRDYYTPQAPIGVDEFGVSGLRAGDVLGISFVTDAVDGSPAGDYPLTPVFNDPFGVLPNYLVTSFSNTFTIYWPFAYIETLDPSVVLRGSGDTTIAIQGDGFVRDVTALQFNGVFVPYTFVSRHALHVTLPAAAFANRGVVFLSASNDPAFAGYLKELFITDAPTTVESAYTAQGYEGDDPVPFEIGSDGTNPSTLFFETLGPGTVTLALFSTNPGSPLPGAEGFFAAFTQPGFASATITTCDLGADGQRLMWFNGTSWVPVANQTSIPGSPACIRALVSDHTSPTLADLAHGYFAVAPDGGDSDAPSISVAASPAVLWPANGAMMPVTVTGVILDTASGIASASVHVSDEYGAVQPNAAITVGVDGSYSVTLLLEASRLPTDANGRRYTIQIDAVDHAGNAATASAIALVPYFLNNARQGRILGDGRLVNGTTYYDVSVNAKKHSTTGEVGYFNVKRVTPNRTDRFVSDRVTGMAFMLGSGSLIDSAIYLGTGKWNGQAGYRFEAYVIDRGDPGPGMDEVHFTVLDPAGVIVAAYRGRLAQWNIKATTY